MMHNYRLPPGGSITVDTFCVFLSYLGRDLLANYFFIHQHPYVFLCTMNVYDTLNINIGQSTQRYLKQEVYCQPSYDSKH